MAEKRKHNRMAADYEVFLTCRGRSAMARCRDISPHGIGIYSTEAMTPGEAVELRVVIPRTMLNVEVAGRVCYCLLNPDPSRPTSSQLVGIVFQEDLKEGYAIAGPQTLGQEYHYSASHSVSIEAPASICYRAIADFERYPEWAGVVTKVRVLSRHPDGRGLRVEFENNFYFLKMSYRNDYAYDDRNLILSWESAGGDLLSNIGRYTFRPQGDKLVSTTFDVTIGLNFPVSERIIKYLSLYVMRKTLRDFKSYVEKTAGSSSPA